MDNLPYDHILQIAAYLLSDHISYLAIFACVSTTTRDAARALRAQTPLNREDTFYIIASQVVKTAKALSQAKPVTFKMGDSTYLEPEGFAYTTLAPYVILRPEMTKPTYLGRLDYNFYLHETWEAGEMAYRLARAFIGVKAFSIDVLYDGEFPSSFLAGLAWGLKAGGGLTYQGPFDIAYRFQSETSGKSVCFLKAM